VRSFVIVISGCHNTAPDFKVGDKVFVKAQFF